MALRIRKVPGSDLGRKIAYTDRIFYGFCIASRENRVCTVNDTVTAFFVTLSSLLFTVVTQYIPLRFENYQNTQHSLTATIIGLVWLLVSDLLEAIIRPTGQYVDGLTSKTYLGRLLMRILPLYRVCLKCFGRLQES